LLLFDFFPPRVNLETIIDFDSCVILD